MSAARTVSVSRLIDASPEALFALLDNPTKHPLFDGSGTVRASRAPDRHLHKGDRFAMAMRYGLPYRITNRNVEYEANRLIAWAHFGGHRWRFQLEAVEGGTRVTETFDWSTSKQPWFIELMGYPRKHPPAMAKTLERLAGLASAPT